MASRVLLAASRRLQRDHSRLRSDRGFAPFVRGPSLRRLVSVSSWLTGESSSRRTERRHLAKETVAFNVDDEAESSNRVSRRGHEEAPLLKPCVALAAERRNRLDIASLRLRRDRRNHDPVVRPGDGSRAVVGLGSRQAHRQRVHRHRSRGAGERIVGVRQREVGRSRVRPAPCGFALR